MEPARNEQIEAGRLFAATEAVLQGIEEFERETGKVCPFPPDLLGTPDQPRAFVEFTRDEIFEGTRFLVRLGVIVVKASR